jgi:hypothetical protein
MQANKHGGKAEAGRGSMHPLQQLRVRAEKSNLAGNEEAAAASKAKYSKDLNSQRASRNSGEASQQHIHAGNKPGREWPTDEPQFSRFLWHIYTFSFSLSLYSHAVLCDSKIPLGVPFSAARR